MRIIKKGATSQTIYVEILDSTSTTGGRKTGLVYNSTSLIGYYVRNGGLPVAITLATLAAANSAWSSGGFKEVDATNMKGVYRLDVPDAAFATGVDSVVVTVSGATGMVQVSEEIQLVAWDPQDAVHGGMSALPNAAANAAGGLPVSIAGALDLDEMNVDIEAIQTSTAGLTYSVANQVDSNVLDWKGAVAPAMSGDAFARLGAPVGASIAADIAEVEAETDLIGTDTAGVTTLLARIPGTVQPQTGDSFARLGAPAGASIAADLAEIEAETDNIAVGGVTVTTNNDKSGYSLSGPVQVDMTQAVPTVNAAQTHGDALNAARAQGFGKWTLVGTTLSLFAADGVTTVKTFVLDSASTPTSRS